MAHENEDAPRHTAEAVDGKSLISCGNIVTPDGSALLRPQRLEGLNLILVAIALIIAAIIGYNLYSFASNNFVYANERHLEAVNAQISRGETVNLPSLDLLVGYDEAGASANLLSAGYTTFEPDSVEGSAYETVKIPSDMTAEQAKKVYESGIAKADAATAAKLLTGMWRLSMGDGDEGKLLTLRYADFNSGSAASAISAAMMAEGLVEDSVTDSGIDESGNTYKVGTGSSNGIDFTWRVSTCELKEIYNIDVLPNSAMYVVVRISY